MDLVIHCVGSGSPVQLEGRYSKVFYRNQTGVYDAPYFVRLAPAFALPGF